MPEKKKTKFGLIIELINWFISKQFVNFVIGVCMGLLVGKFILFAKVQSANPVAKKQNCVTVATASVTLATATKMAIVTIPTKAKIASDVISPDIKDGTVSPMAIPVASTTK